jgi:hypothetical protein
MMEQELDLRANPHRSVGSIPKADFARVRTPLWRDPRCRDSVKLHQKEEYQANIPCLEGWPLAVQTFMSVSDDVKTNGHGDEEDPVRVGLQADNYEAHVLVKLNRHEQPTKTSMRK